MFGKPESERNGGGRPGKPLESHIGNMVVNILMVGPALAQWRREREEASRKRGEEERRRPGEAERYKKDRNQWRRFLELSSQWKEAQAVGEFLGVIKQSARSAEEKLGGQTAEEWIAWVQEGLQRYDPVVNGIDAVFHDVSQVIAWTNRE